MSKPLVTPLELLIDELAAQADSFGLSPGARWRFGFDAFVISARGVDGVLHVLRVGGLALPAVRLVERLAAQHGVRVRWPGLETDPAGCLRIDDLEPARVEDSGPMSDRLITPAEVCARLGAKVERA